MSTEPLSLQAAEPAKQVHLRSNWTMALLIAAFALLAAASVLLSGEMMAGQMPAGQKLPAPLWVLALLNGVIVLVPYGILAVLAMILSRKIGLPELWDPAVSNWKRFLIPLLIGVVGGVVLIAGDSFLSQFNPLGALPHPAFPLSLIASFTAGVGEELVFRFFFISFWTWLISKIILKGRWQDSVYWVTAVISALVFAASHFPALLSAYRLSSIAQLPTTLTVEIFLLNGVIGLLAAWLMKRFGYLAAVGTHFWVDVVWHVIWGAISA